MSLLHKAGLGLVVLAALGQAGAASANEGIDVTPTVTGSAGAFTYSYAVTPTDIPFTSKPLNLSSLDFTFSDSKVSFVSTNGPLNDVTEPVVGSGSFFAVASNGHSTLNSGTTETFVFSSPDASSGGLLNVSGSGKIGAGSSGPVAGPGPAPVPEASTMVSFGLLLALGLGGLVVSARKKALVA